MIYITYLGYKKHIQLWQPAHSFGQAILSSLASSELLRVTQCHFDQLKSLSCGIMKSTQ